MAKFTVILSGPHDLQSLRHVDASDEYDAVEVARKSLQRSDSATWVAFAMFAGHLRDLLSRAAIARVPCGRKRA
ncbi:MAG TPA: hypothetical protein VM711_10975 [Sphingomicrobium sp.]|nr:hypothetical protein [Sphingomicrobium sp.]